MTKSNNLGADQKASYCIYFRILRKTYQRETYFVIFSVLKETTSLCNGYVAFEKAVYKYFMEENLHFCFSFSRSSMFKNKGVIFLNDKL